MQKNRIVEGRFIGFHDKERLPIKRGDVVIVRKGVKYHSMRDGQWHISKKNYKVKVDHVLSGCQYMDNGQEVTTNPEVSWAGRGRYWHRADINDVLKF
jgi:hypothetical protein